MFTLSCCCCLPCKSACINLFWGMGAIPFLSRYYKWDGRDAERIFCGFPTSQLWSFRINKYLLFVYKNLRVLVLWTILNVSFRLWILAKYCNKDTEIPVSLFEGSSAAQTLSLKISVLRLLVNFKKSVALPVTDHLLAPMYEACFKKIRHFVTRIF
jgi:hypothetical protein